MYIKTIKDENIGPIENVKIDFPFAGDGTPKPVILVGENGSGKSLFLSNIVDSFYSMAYPGFDNALKKADTGGEEYYKNISALQIKIGKKYLYSYVTYTDEGIYYIFKAGQLSVKDFNTYNNSDIPNNRWKINDNYKSINVTTEEQSTDIFSQNVICYFGPDRYEKPNWMGTKYYSTLDNEHLALNKKEQRHLDNPISIKSVTEQNLKWLLDVVVDSRVDIEKEGENYNTKYVPVDYILKLGQTRKNVETIMSKILDKEVYFHLKSRHSCQGRFEIRLTKDNSVLVPSLDSLSTGQIALFNMFSTIVKYADNQDMEKSIRLDKIQGIVIIDEIELHLHPSMQRDVLPKLLFLFPRIQFIISTHSPLFLLGMNEEFGSENYEIYQLPNANKISVESFSEFQKAYTYFKQTQTYMQEIRNAIKDYNHDESKALIITEGATDWKHMKAAYEKIKRNQEYENLKFDFLEYEPKNSNKQATYKLEMGNTRLCSMCEEYAKLLQPRKLIFIADCDDDDTQKKLLGEFKRFKKWGNNVYSFTLPIPEHRRQTPKICIEHYYTDEEIKTSKDIDGIQRRLYLGNEFDKRGYNRKLNICCEKKNKCGPNSIHVLDGSEHEKITKLSDEEINIALPKMDFAEGVLNNEEPFASFNIKSFYELFTVIKEILEDDET